MADNVSFQLKASRYIIAGAVATPMFATFFLRTQQHLDQITYADTLALTIVNYVGDATFALTGTLAAGFQDLDLLGCLIVGFVTALGGGTVRDVLLGRLPICWMVDWEEALLCVSVSLLTFFAWPAISKRFALTLEDEWLFWTDTVGLGVFAANGAHTGVSVGSIVDGDDTRLNFFACALCGMLSATFGGVTRDILIGRKPRILHSACELYAVPAFLGGLATTAVLRSKKTMVLEGVLFGVSVTVLARVIAANHDLRLPVFPKEARPPDSPSPSNLAGLLDSRDDANTGSSDLYGDSTRGSSRWADAAGVTAEDLRYRIKRPANRHSCPAR